MQIAATFELFVTILAVIELLVFMGVVAPAFDLAHFTPMAGRREHLQPGGGRRYVRRHPLAIWFFLAIEGVAMAAEEAKDPKRTIPIAYITGVLTLTALAFGVMLFAGAWGLADPQQSQRSAAPGHEGVVGTSSGWLHMLVWLGLFGLVASFHGIIMGYSRQISPWPGPASCPRPSPGCIPASARPTPATLAGGAVGIVAIYSDSLDTIAGQSLTASIVTMAVFGALVMYGMSMASLFRLRRSEPDLARPYRAPFYPVAPAIALALAAICFLALVIYNPLIFVLFLTVMVLAVAASLLAQVGGGETVPDGGAPL